MPLPLSLPSALGSTHHVEPNFRAEAAPPDSYLYPLSPTGRRAMGEGLKKMFDEIRLPLGAEDDEDLGHDSDVGEESDGCCSTSPSPKQIPSSPSSRSISASPLEELSSLVEQLPINKGLSRYYKGKSQSYRSLSEVKSLEDLPKKYKEIQHTSKMKPCKSYAGGLNEVHKAIPMKSSSPPSAASCSSSIAMSAGSSFLAGIGRPPPIPVNKNQWATPS
ncbi:hypothetical protein AXF42_Ash005650 [Apostasia shenzhenica]|uniref:Uncharacterized protein n=1 Tax=Apostasia shenzhenica TaxID=1088818 RepID=A0A2I0BC01_9ASPA|nr:hypothetical protein AXF42_Ash005650 [Apostasia shenzhenica]